MQQTIQHTVAGFDYQFGKLGAIPQFHIARRLAPLMTDFAPLFISFRSSPEKLEKLKAGDLSEVVDSLAPFANSLAKMEEADANAVLFGLLACVGRKNPGGGFSPVVAPGAHALMFQDIDMAVMVQLAGRALVHNLSGFFAALPSASPPAAEIPKT